MLLFVLLLLSALALGAVYLLRGRRGADANGGGLDALLADLPRAGDAAAEAAPEPEIPQVDNTGWNFLGRVEQTINEMEIVEPDYRMYALAENARVDLSYFDTVTFIGDSITQGLEIYPQAGIPNAHYCAYKGVGPKQIYDGSVQRRVDGSQEVPMESLLESAPDNVYILLGTNAMVGMDDESLLAYYDEMLEALKQQLPEGVGIYVQSITPVMAGTPRFELPRIHTLNNALAQMAWEKGLYYLDLHEALAGEDGWLRPDYGSQRDGYHLTPAGYSAWVDYLVTHTAHRPDNPYVEAGEPYAQRPVAE